MSANGNTYYDVTLSKPGQLFQTEDDQDTYFVDQSLTQKAKLIEVGGEHEKWST